MIKRKLARCGQPLTIFGAVAITVLSVWLLAVLNVRATSGVQPSRPIRTVVIREPEYETFNQDQRQEEPDSNPVEPEIMEVDLDMPQLDPIEPEPLQLDLPLPSPTVMPIQVTVEKPKPKPVPKPAPPKPAPKKVAPKPPAKPRVRSAASVDQPPRESRSNQQPPYPEDELKKGIGGVVTLKLLIDERGHIEDVQVLDGGSAFVKSVMAVVWKWRFTPAKDEGQPVKVWGVKRVRFRVRS